MKTASDSIWLDFFLRLRKSAGMELDMTQYYLFLELFIKGNSSSPTKSWDYESLLNLCRTLWLTHSKYADVFKTWFDEALDEIIGRWLPEFVEPDPQIDKVEEKTGSEGRSDVDKKLENEQTKTGDESKIDQAKTKSDDKAIEESANPKGTSSPLNLFDISLNFEESSRSSHAAGKTTVSKTSEKDTEFIFSDDKHLPIPTRRLGHALQKLRMQDLRISSDVLNMNGIVQQYGQQRFVGSLEYEKESVSSQSIVLLTDHEGSMSSFEPWGNYLHRQFEEHPSVDKLERLYFHNCPNGTKNSYGSNTFKLFTNRSHTASILAEQLIGKVKNQCTWLVIFSDAGAYDRGVDAEVIRDWWEFIVMVKPHVNAITWINPLPEGRWMGTTGGTLSLLVKMVPFNLEGMRQAIKWANNANRNRTS